MMTKEKKSPAEPGAGNSGVVTDILSDDCRTCPFSWSLGSPHIAQLEQRTDSTMLLSLQCVESSCRWGR